MELELLVWGDGTIRLTYWDSAAGADKVFLLGDDGRAYLTDYGDDDDQEIRRPVDLVLSLRQMAKDRQP
jgi:hypothetical protein